MKWLFFTFLTLLTQLSLGQSVRDTAKKSDKAVGTRLDVRQLRRDEILAYADSINRFKGGKLPTFLLNPCFDWKRSYWPDLHTATSVRWMVLEKVNNKQALKALLLSQDKCLKQKCSQVNDAFLRVPMIDRSFYELIRKRYRQL